MSLSAEAGRVLGSLVEKAFTTPQQYPLTFASLMAACNQASNRDPVVDYDEPTVLAALDELKAQRLVRFVLPSSGRTALRYRQVLDETLALDRPQCALLAALLLRGPQTVGELRLRTDRMTEFSGLQEVERELGLLASLEEPLARNLSRRPGQKEERWDCPLVPPAPGRQGGVERDGTVSDPAHEGESSGELAGPRPLAGEDLNGLRSDVTALRSEVDELRRQLDALRASLGG
jgi:uncharacterized protein YceH (UPF0502 family)